MASARRVPSVWEVAKRLVTASMSVGAAHLASPLDGPGESFPQMQTSSLALDNTNSQFYMWEPANPTERADFEEDLIASTNENLYLTPLASKTGKAGFAADSSDLFRSSLFVDDFRPESLIPRRARDDALTAEDASA